MIVKKTRYSCENIVELLGYLETELDKKLGIKTENRDKIVLYELKDDGTHADLPENGGVLQKVWTPCGSKVYYRWDEDIPIFHPEELEARRMGMRG